MANDMTIYQSVIGDASKRNHWYLYEFYQCFSDVEIVNSCVHNLTWTYFRSLSRTNLSNMQKFYVLDLNLSDVSDKFKKITHEKNLGAGCLNSFSY